MATEKQVKFCFVLLKKAGFSTKTVDQAFTALGATPDQIGMAVEEWLNLKDVKDMSAFIDGMVNEQKPPEAVEQAQGGPDDEPW